MCPYYTADNAKQALSLTATSVCQAASFWVQYFLNNDASGLINKPAGAAFLEKFIWPDEAHSQVSLFPIAYQPNLSISLCNQYKRFLVKWNRRAERTVHLIHPASPEAPACSFVILCCLTSKCNGLGCKPKFTQPKLCVSFSAQCLPLARCFWGFAARLCRTWAART